MPKLSRGVVILIFSLSTLVVTGYNLVLMQPTDSVNTPSPHIREITVMNEPIESTPVTVRLEASTEIRNADFQVRAGFRTSQSEVLAGGPLTLDFFVENQNSTPVYLVVGGDRARHRPGSFSFSATVEGIDIDLSDPAASLRDLGGPAGVVEIGQKTPFHQRVLVNQFLTLEKLRDALVSGKEQFLTLHCQRPLALALDSQQALRTVSDGQKIDLTLTIPIRRDDNALQNLIIELADTVSANESPNAAGEREWLMTQLVALRNPTTVPYLQSLSQHSDPTVRMLAQQGLESLR